MVNNNTLINDVLNIIKSDETLSKKLIIKGGISISIILNTENRETRDIDTYFIKDETNIDTWINKIINVLSSQGDFDEIKYLDKHNKIKISKMNSNIEISFINVSNSEVPQSWINNDDGLLIIDIVKTIFDKVDRVARLWKNNKPVWYDEMSNLIKRNKNRDYFDLYYLRNYLSESKITDFNNFYNECKEFHYKNNPDTNCFLFKNLDEMMFWYDDFISFMNEDKKVRHDGLPVNFSKLTIESPNFNTNYKIPEYTSLIKGMSEISSIIKEKSKNI